MKIPLAFNKITSFSGAAVGLGQGLSIVSSLAISVAGSGYKVGDALTLSGGTFSLVAKTVVTAITSTGGVATLSINHHGCYQTVPSNPVSVTGGSGTGLQLTVTWTTPALPKLQNMWAEITVEGANVRWRDDGTDPTNTVGQLALITVNGEPPWVYYGPLVKFRALGVSAGSVLNVTLYGVSKLEF